MACVFSMDGFKYTPSDLQDIKNTDSYY